MAATSANKQKGQSCRGSTLITLNVHLEASIAVSVKRIISRCINVIFSCVIKLVRASTSHFAARSTSGFSFFFFFPATASIRDGNRLTAFPRPSGAQKSPAMPPRFENPGARCPVISARHWPYPAVAVPLAGWTIAHDYLPTPRPRPLQRVATAISLSRARHSRKERIRATQYSFTRRRRR